MKKNVAGQVVGSILVNKTDGSAVTSGSTSVYITGDNGTQVSGTVGSGAATHKGNGVWTYLPAASETNFDNVDFTFVNSLAIPANIQIYTSFPQTGDNYPRIGAPAGASISADIAAVKSDTGSIKTKTDSLTFTVANQIDSNVIDWKGATAPAMTGDAFARLGAPVGASTSADIAAVKAVLPTALVSGRIDASAGAIAAGAITTTSIADGAFTAAKFASACFAAANFASGAFDAVWSVAARILTAGTNIVLAKGTGVTGFNDLDATAVQAADAAALAAVGVTTTVTGRIDVAVSSRLASGSYTAPLDAAATRSAIGMSSANLDAQLLALDTDVLTRLASSSYTAPDNAGIAAAVTAIDNVPTNAELTAALAPIKTQTDKMTFTVTNQIDANVQYVNDVQVAGTGQDGDRWGPV